MSACGFGFYRGAGIARGLADSFVVLLDSVFVECQALGHGKATPSFLFEL
jgi:hypothetical protein